MVSREVTICNRQGIHCRPSSLVAKEATGYPGTIRLTAQDGRIADARVILQVIALCLTAGQTVTVTVDGPNAEAKCAAVADLLGREFDFPR
jgi:phosphocarrier protein